MCYYSNVHLQGQTVKIKFTRICIPEQNGFFLPQYTTRLAPATFGIWREIKSETITEIYWTKICVNSCTSDGTPPCFALQSLACNTGISTTWMLFWCYDRDFTLFCDVLRLSGASRTHWHKQARKTQKKP